MIYELHLEFNVDDFDSFNEDLDRFVESVNATFGDKYDVAIYGAFTPEV